MTERKTNRREFLETMGAVETALKSCGHTFDAGAGVAAAQRALSE